MPKKPIPPGGVSNKRGRNYKPTPAEKAIEKAKLVSKGVDSIKASELVGEGEDLTQKEIALRRIAWQKTLPKG